MSLPAEHPRDALARDQAMLDDALREPVASGSAASGQAPLVRWWVASAPAVVVGLGLRHRLASIVDIERCRAVGVDVLERRAGGGALLLDEHMLCGAVCLPAANVAHDVTESYRWLGDLLAARLRAAGVSGARRVEVAEAREDVAVLKARNDPVARILLATCYGALSPHEVVVGAAKLVGIAQIRRRRGALFQFGILRRDQSALADYLHVPDEATRAELREALRRRTIGVEVSLGGSQPDQFLQRPR
jgi:lipoate-protein ligase A